MDFFSAMEIVSSGLTAERVSECDCFEPGKREYHAYEEEGPYQRRDPMFKATNVAATGGLL